MASSIAIVLAAAMMTPATTDARGGGGFGGGGFGGGGFGSHGGAIGGGHAHFGGAGAFQNTGPAIPGPATARRFPFASHHGIAPHSFSNRMSLSHRSVTHRFALHHSHAIGSHFATLGYDGVWLDNYVYAPTVLIAGQPVVVAAHSPARIRAPSVKTPGAARDGIILVRGDTKSYVTFPNPKRG